MTVKGRQIAVVGGGVAGLASALALHLHGADVRLFEQAEALRAADWVRDHPAVAGLPVALFGASTGAAAALVAIPMRVGVSSLNLATAAAVVAYRP